MAGKVPLTLVKASSFSEKLPSSQAFRVRAATSPVERLASREEFKPLSRHDHHSAKRVWIDGRRGDFSFRVLHNCGDIAYYLRTSFQIHDGNNTMKTRYRLWVATVLSLA